MPSRRHVVMAALLLGSAAFLLYSLRSARLPGGTGTQGLGPADASRQQAKAADEPLRPAAPPDVGYARYSALAERSLFSRRTRVPPPPKKPDKLPEPPPFDKPGDEDEPRSKMPDFTGWSYVGYVIIDGQQFGIVQNESNQSCECLPVGESFLGAEVEDITRESIKFKSGSRRSTLSRIRDFPVAPLDKGAAAAGAPRQARRR